MPVRIIEAFRRASSHGNARDEVVAQDAEGQGDKHDARRQQVGQGHPPGEPGPRQQLLSLVLEHNRWKRGEQTSEMVIRHTDGSVTRLLIIGVLKRPMS